MWKVVELARNALMKGIMGQLGCIQPYILCIPANKILQLLLRSSSGDVCLMQCKARIEMKSILAFEHCVKHVSPASVASYSEQGLLHNVFPGCVSVQDCDL